VRSQRKIHYQFVEQYYCCKNSSKHWTKQQAISCKTDFCPADTHQITVRHLCQHINVNIK